MKGDGNDEGMRCDADTECIVEEKTRIAHTRLASLQFNEGEEEFE